MADQIEPCLVGFRDKAQPFSHVHKCMLWCTHAGEIHKCLCGRTYLVPGTGPVPEEVGGVD